MVSAAQLRTSIRGEEVGAEQPAVTNFEIELRFFRLLCPCFHLQGQILATQQLKPSRVKSASLQNFQNIPIHLLLIHPEKRYSSFTHQILLYIAGLTYR